jgi:NADH-quinone oxidoreductase subunit N
MSSAILLYGMALLYGITGATSLPAIARAITQQPSLAAVLSMCMLLAGFGFKIAAAPFQLWTPDVYQGAPTPVTAFFSVASKAAGFAVILRIFNQGLPALSPEWGIVFGVLALITMTLGNLIAIVQTNIKRLMAYSSITHVGYMLIGLATIAVPGGANVSASTGVMYYLLSYTVTNLAAFIVITVMTPVAPDDEIEGYAGLGTRSPALGIALTAALLSLAGIPPFAGFFAKLFLFAAAIQAQSLGLQLLVVWAVIMSAVSLYYYGRIIHSIWMRDAADTVVMRPGFGQGVALAASVTGMILFGVVGAPFLSLAQTAATNFLR